MKKIVIILTLVTITLVAFAGPVQELMELAELAFSKGDYIKAKGFYSDIINLQSATENQREDARYNVNVCQFHINEAQYNSGYNRALSLFNAKQFVKSRNFCVGLLKYGKHRKKTNKLIQQCNDSINARFLAQQVADSIQRRNQLRDEYNTIIDEALAYYNNKQYLDAINLCKNAFNTRFDILGESIPSWFVRSNQIYSAQCKGDAITPEFAAWVNNAINLGNINNGIARIVKRSSGNKNDSTFYVTPKGNLIIKTSGYKLNDFHNSYLADDSDFGFGGFIDGTGRFHSSDSIGKVNYVRTKKLVYIRQVHEFSDHMAPFKDKHNKWGYLNADFSIIIQPRYDVVTAFTNGYALVRDNRKWFVIDKTGNIVLKDIFPDPRESNMVFFDYHSQYRYGENPLCGYASGKWSVVDKNGKSINQFSYMDLPNRSISDGLLAINIDGKWGFQDSNGTVVINPIYDWVKDFSEGFAVVSFNGRLGYVDIYGNSTFDYQ